MKTACGAAVLAACALCAPASSQVREADTLAERTRAAIVEALSRQSWPQAPPSVDVEVSGEPVVRPEHARYHRDGRPARHPGQMPDAIVHAVVRESKDFQQTALVYFVVGQAFAHLSYSGSPGFLPLEERQWRDVASALSPFYATAVDISRGPERFREFLPDDMRGMLRQEQRKRRLFLPTTAVDQLTNDELRQFVAMAFDTFVVRAWVAFEGVQQAIVDPPQDRLLQSDPRAFMTSFEQFLVSARVALRDHGTLDAEHLALCSPYMRRIIGEGLVAREDPARDPVRSVPAGEPMYAAPLGGPSGVFPHFVLAGGTVRVVAVDMP